MKHRFSPLDLAAALRLLLAALALCAAGLAAADRPLPTTQLRIGKHALRVEIVSSDEERSRGLMFRKKLGANDGMLFLFDDPDRFVEVLTGFSAATKPARLDERKIEQLLRDGG